MATVKLTKVNIGLSKIYTTSNVDGEIVTKEEISIPLDNELTPTFMGAATKITFSTITGKLSDNEYATQANGFHWVKLPGYKMYKIDPKFISKNILSQEGITFLQTNSALE